LEFVDIAFKKDACITTVGEGVGGERGSRAVLDYRTQTKGPNIGPMEHLPTQAWLLYLPFLESTSHTCCHTMLA
jgi:hypothetical protein